MSAFVVNAAGTQVGPLMFIPSIIAAGLTAYWDSTLQPRRSIASIALLSG